MDVVFCLHDVYFPKANGTRNKESRKYSFFSGPISKPSGRILTKKNSPKMFGLKEPYFLPNTANLPKYYDFANRQHNLT